jgi:hypothetical protein
MIQPWIHKAKTDSVFILAPSFIVLVLVFLFQEWFVVIEENYSFYTWLFLIVFIDVAHVYSTLFKTYLVKSEFERHKQLYIGLPIFCFLIGFVLFLFGSQVFWSVLAYVAVFHFIRQQYGFMRLYSRNETKTHLWIDKVVIYTATIYPMLFWFLSPKRKFNWFVENEFFTYENPLVLQLLTWIYFVIIASYVVRTVYNVVQSKYFNIPKNAVILGTILSWYFGIVYFNNDLVFTLLNVVSHGIPYMALVYLNEIEKKSKNELGFLSLLQHFKGVLFFIGILLFIAFSEEFLWEIFVWNEQISILNFDFSNWQFVVVPLLTVPQFTHYLLDGFIWKSKTN